MRTRKGFSLVEVMVVVVILAVAAVSAQMLAPRNALRAVESAAECRKLEAALRMARQTAIARQSDVRVQFTGNNQRISGYVVQHRTAGGYVALIPTELISDLPVATVNSLNITFSATGTADTPLSVSLGNGRQTHRLTVIPGSGQVRYAKL